MRIKAKLKAGSETGKRAHLEKTISATEKARKHCEMLLQASDLDPIKVCTAMYDSDWDGDIWNRPDGSDEEVSKVSDCTNTALD